MKPLLALIVLFGLAGCSSPRLYTGIGIGPGGITVTPVASARVGGATVSVSP